MAFSLFGKKPAKNETPLVKKVEERQRAMREKAQAPARPAAPESPPVSEAGEDLDFTNFVPAGGSPTPSEPSAPPQPAKPPSPPSIAPQAKSPLDELDFSIFKDPPAANAAEKPASKKKVAKPVDSILCIEVEEGGGHDIPAPIEEGAVLFANGQAEDALARLKPAVEKGNLGAWQLQAWLMMFDLLQHTGKRTEFEEKALEFVVKFERSPPVWVEAPPKAPATAAARAGAAANIVLTGALGAQSGPAFEQLRKAAEKQSRLKLDFAKLQAVEPEGAVLLLDTLRHLRGEKKEVVLSGEQTLAKLLRERAPAGDNTADQAIWLLLLEVYQQLGLQEEFEEAAVDFAVTYEVSPPSFDPVAVKAKTTPPAASIAKEDKRAGTGEDEAFRVSGEVAGMNDQLFADLSAYGATANPVVVDMTATRRIDFINAGRLLNVLEKLKAEGRPIVIRGAGEMIIALFAVMGIPKVARVIPRK